MPDISFPIRALTQLATFRLPESTLKYLRNDADRGNPLALELLGSNPTAMAVEIITGENESADSFAVLLSATDDAENPAKLTCVLGLCNNPDWCDLGRGFGFPMIEASIKRSSETLTVTAAVFPEPVNAGPSVLEERKFLTLEGYETGRGGDEEGPSYKQRVSSPDPDRSASEMICFDFSPVLLKRSVRPSANPERTKVVFESGLRYPNFFALIGSILTAHEVWVGSVVLRNDERPEPDPAKLYRLPLATIFGPPIFRFEGLEIIGFRVDGSRWSEGLSSLMAQLQRDVKERNDFDYRLATGIFAIELLRYGEMKSAQPLLPLQPGDYMSQHELLVRLLVGRVDDDTAQARDPAAFVPAIFVDNPWSKAVGRELQGFPKDLAEFCARTDDRFARLHWDGTVKNGSSSLIPLTKVAAVRRVRSLDHQTRELDDCLLTIDYSTDFLDDQFNRVDLCTVLGAGALPEARWRQTDFDSREFRRSFARQVVADGFVRFGSLQQTPLDNRFSDFRGKAFVTGDFTLEDVAVQFPEGIASLALRTAGLKEDHPWAILCKLLEDAGMKTIDLPTGSWYRMKCSMNLKINNGLDW